MLVDLDGAVLKQNDVVVHGSVLPVMEIIPDPLISVPPSFFGARADVSIT